LWLTAANTGGFQAIAVTNHKILSTLGRREIAGCRRNAGAPPGTIEARANFRIIQSDLPRHKGQPWHARLANLVFSLYQFYPKTIFLSELGCSISRVDVYLDGSSNSWTRFKG
jgi:hypothetical protein